MEEREKFVKDIGVQLALCDYGLETNHNYNINKINAIRELNIRMNVWKITGKKDYGKIIYNEAKRIIEYKLDTDVSKCKVNLIKQQVSEHFSEN